MFGIPWVNRKVIEMFSDLKNDNIFFLELHLNQILSIDLQRRTITLNLHTVLSWEDPWLDFLVNILHFLLFLVF